MENRPSWHQYFMEMAFLASQRSTCLRRKVGAVVVSENQILATGYNGAPKHVQHCGETGCIRQKLNTPSGTMHELCRGVHAEQNAIVQAAINGTSIRNSTLYCTNHPCSICAKMIINAEIKNVYIADDYPDPLAKDMFAEAGVELILVDRESNKLTKLI